MTTPTTTVKGMVVVATLLAAMTFGGTADAQEADSECITGLTYAIDAMETGSAAGPPIVYSAAISVVGVALPPPDSPAAPVAQPAFQAFVAAAFEVTDQSSQGGQQFAGALREATQPLAAGTDQGDAFAQDSADALDESADMLEPAIQPGDRTMRQLADLLRASDCS